MPESRGERGARGAVVQGGRSHAVLAAAAVPSRQKIFLGLQNRVLTLFLLSLRKFAVILVQWLARSVVDLTIASLLRASNCSAKTRVRFSGVTRFLL